LWSFSARKVPGEDNHRQQHRAESPPQGPGDALPQRIEKNPDPGKSLNSPHGQLSPLFSQQSFEA